MSAMNWGFILTLPTIPWSVFFVASSAPAGQLQDMGRMISAKVLYPMPGRFSIARTVVNKRAKTPVACVVFSVIAAILVVADQIIKRTVVAKVPVYEQVDVIKGFFSIYHCRNTGSAFSLFADQAWGIYVLTGISVILGFGIFILML